MKKYIGDKKFYKMVFLIAIPIMLQQGISNFVNLLDNVMVGRLGNEQMSGVAIVNQLIFVFNICIFGCVAGTGIYSAQFTGKKDQDGIRNCLRMKIMITTLFSAIAITILFFARNTLINLYLHEGTEKVGDLALTYENGEKYLLIMLFGLFVAALSQCYSSTLREYGETVVPMISSLAAVLVNLILNTILIFGFLGFPALGVQGAAIATVISRYVELGILVFYTHTRTYKFPFIVGLYKSFRIPLRLWKDVVKTGLPLFVNEALWSTGMAFLSQCYATRGLIVVSANNITSTVNNIFIIFYIALGSAISIIVGQQLGAGEVEKAKDTDRKLIFFSVCVNIFIGLILISLSKIIPKIYNTPNEVKELATVFLTVVAIMMPVHAFNHACYFTLRSGGRTFITFLFDSTFMWIIHIPIAFVVSRYSNIPIIPMYIIIQGVEVLKAPLGAILLKKSNWARKII